MPNPSDKPPLTIRYGNAAGPYFTQWRFDELAKMAQALHRELIETSAVLIRYDAENDFHMLEFSSGGHAFLVRFYRVYSLVIDGVDNWIGCPPSRFFDFVQHIGEQAQRPVKVNTAELKPEGSPCTKPGDSS